MVFFRTTCDELRAPPLRVFFHRYGLITNAEISRRFVKERKSVGRNRKQRYRCGSVPAILWIDRVARITRPVERATMPGRDRESIDRAAGMAGKLTMPEKIVGRWKPIDNAAGVDRKLSVPGRAPCRWEPLDRFSNQDRPACEPQNVTPL